MTLSPALARVLGRQDLNRSRFVGPTSGRGEAGATYPPNAAGMSAGGRGATAVGLSGGLQLSTETLSEVMLAAIVIGLGGFYIWTRGHQG